MEVLNNLKTDDGETSIPKIEPVKADEATGLAPLIADHYNKNKDDGIEERKNSRIYHLRNFNNWIKSMFIDEQLKEIKKNLEEKSRNYFVNFMALDLCCGKGGDLKKWLHGKMGHVIFADIAETSMEQCKTRYDKLRSKNFSAEFFTADCTKTRIREKMSDVTLKLDLVSCQFAFHYCFESLPQAQCMLKNASECLRPGGRFIGTMPNSTEIVRKLRESKGEKFGNECYSITPYCQEPYPIFGAKYDFQLEEVVNCPEFLVHFPTLVELAKKYGLKLISVKTFPKFYEEIVAQGKYLLERMSALETYPAPEDKTLCGAEEQYSHADGVMKSSSSAVVGTMSADEWEVCSLYLLFVFEKVEISSYDQKGNPIFNIS